MPRRSTLSSSLLVLAALLTVACGAPEDDCVEDDFTVIREFAGPAWDPDDGLLEEPRSSYTAHVTYAKMRPEKRDEFLARVDEVVAQMEESGGLIGFSYGVSDACDAVRTVGVWEDEESIRAFAYSGSHMLAIAEFGMLASRGATSRWEIAGDELPPTIEDGKRELEP